MVNYYITNWNNCLTTGTVIVFFMLHILNWCTEQIVITFELILYITLSILLCSGGLCLLNCACKQTTIQLKTQLYFATRPSLHLTQNIWQACRESELQRCCSDYLVRLSEGGWERQRCQCLNATVLELLSRRHCTCRRALDGSRVSVPLVVLVPGIECSCAGRTLLWRRSRLGRDCKSLNDEGCAIAMPLCQMCSQCIAWSVTIDSWKFVVLPIVFCHRMASSGLSAWETLRRPLQHMAQGSPFRED